MILTTPSGAVSLAQAPVVNLPLVPSTSRGLDVLPAEESVQPAAPANGINTRQERAEASGGPHTPANSNFQSAVQPQTTSARGTDTLFLAQLFGSDGSDISAQAAQFAFTKAAETYRNILSPSRTYSITLSPEQLKEFSEVKYKPGLKPPVEDAGISLVA